MPSSGTGSRFVGGGRRRPVTPKERPKWDSGPSFSSRVEDTGLLGAVWDSFTTRTGQGLRLAGEKIGNDVSGVLDIAQRHRETLGNTPLGQNLLEGTAMEDWNLIGGSNTDAASLGGQHATSRQAQHALLQETEHFLSDVASPVLDVLDAMDGVPLDALSQYQAEQARLTIEEQMVDLDKQLEQMQLNMTMQNQFYDTYEEAAFGGEIVKDPAMATAIDQGGEETGLSPDVLNAVTSIMNDPSLSGAERMARVDFMLDQASTQQQIRMEINDVTQNYTDLERIHDLPDVQLLLEQGITPSYVTTAFNYLQDPEIAYDPEVRYASNVDTYLNEFIADAGLELPPEQEELFGNWLTMIGNNPDWDDPAMQGQLSNFASVLGTDAATLRGAVSGALKSANVSEDAWANALSKKRLEPGSEEMAVAIYQVATELKLPPEVADAYAESVGLHAIIKAKSGGMVGQRTGGTQIGIGGLSENAYRELGIDPANLGDMKMELGALIMYIEENFEGDPTAALSYFYSTGDWGA